MATGKRFSKTLNIWALTDEQIKNLLPGQWVSAGENGDKGRFYGIKQSGSVVVAWNGNAKASGNYHQYQKTLHTYAKSH